jgi:hypothetical protein
MHLLSIDGHPVSTRILQILKTKDSYIKSHTQTQKIGHRTLFVAGRINFVITQFTGFAIRA